MGKSHVRHAVSLYSDLHAAHTWDAAHGQAQFSVPTRLQCDQVPLNAVLRLVRIELHGKRAV